jgi:hypothetical protein
MFPRLLLAFLPATVLTYSLATVAHTQQVLVRLSDMGVSLSAADCLSVVVGDWLGMYLYLMVIAVGLLLAFTIAALLPVKAPYCGMPMYALAGALAMLVILLSMREFASLTPIAGARGGVGLFLQCLAGAFGGMCFDLLRCRLLPWLSVR